MNKKFNLYCVLMLVAVVFSLSVPMATTFSKGFTQGWTDTDKNSIGYHPITGVMNPVELLPRHTPTVFHDSIYNKKTQEMEGIQIFSGLIHTPKVSRSDYKLYSTVVTASGILTGILGILFLIVLIKIVLAVNKGKIFDAKMEKRMAQGGWLMIASYGLSWFITYMQYVHNTSIYDFENYIVCILRYPNAAFIVGGIGLLLIGQIFKIARKMKEDQELTI